MCYLYKLDSAAKSVRSPVVYALLIKAIWREFFWKLIVINEEALIMTFDTWHNFAEQKSVKVIKVDEFA